MANESSFTTVKKACGRARITNGKRLLPTAHARSVWARIMGDTFAAILAHIGGPDQATEPQRLTARRVAVLETEMLFQEDKLARLRQDGKEPDGDMLTLYAALGNAQRRHLEAIGYQRVPRDITPDPLTYAANYRREEKEEE